MSSAVDMAANFAAMTAALHERFGIVLRSSIRISPDHTGGRPDLIYWNAVAALSTDMGALTLCETLKTIEANLGRRPDRITADLDLLLLGAGVDPTAGIPRDRDLRLPHVYEPLLEIAPDITHPNGMSLRDWLGSVQSR